MCGHNGEFDDPMTGKCVICADDPSPTERMSMELPARIGTIDVDLNVLAQLLRFPHNVRIVRGCEARPGAIRLVIENPEFDEVQPGQPIPEYHAMADCRWTWIKLKKDEVPNG